MKEIENREIGSNFGNLSLYSEWGSYGYGYGDVWRNGFGNGIEYEYGFGNMDGNGRSKIK
jgi:hypothetical protein